MLVAFAAHLRTKIKALRNLTVNDKRVRATITPVPVVRMYVVMYFGGFTNASLWHTLYACGPGIRYDSRNYGRLYAVTIPPDATVGGAPDHLASKLSKT